MNKFRINAGKTGSVDFPIMLEISTNAPVGFWARLREAWATVRGLHIVHRVYLKPENVDTLRKVLHE